jgi:hypothetical protein
VKPSESTLFVGFIKYHDISTGSSRSNDKFLLPDKHSGSVTARKTSIATVKHSWLHCKELDFDAIEILCLLPNLLVGYLFLLSGW